MNQINDETHRLWFDDAYPQLEPLQHEVNHLVVLWLQRGLEVQLGPGQFVGILQDGNDKGHKQSIDEGVERVEEEVAEDSLVLQSGAQVSTALHHAKHCH